MDDDPGGFPAGSGGALLTLMTGRPFPHENTHVRMLSDPPVPPGAPPEYPDPDKPPPIQEPPRPIPIPPDEPPPPLVAKPRALAPAPL